MADRQPGAPPSRLDRQALYRNATPHQGSFRETLDALALGLRDHLLEIGNGGGTFSLHETDAAHLPFADGEFTAAAMTNVFFFVYQAEAVLAEIRRTLAPGGRIAIYTDATAFMAPPFIADRMRFYTDDQLNGVLQDAGYAAITLQRTGPGRRVQLVTGRNGDAHEPVRYQSAEPGDFSSVFDRAVLTAALRPVLLSYGHR